MSLILTLTLNLSAISRGFVPETKATSVPNLDPNPDSDPGPGPDPDR